MKQSFITPVALVTIIFLFISCKCPSPCPPCPDSSEINETAKVDDYPSNLLGADAPPEDDSIIKITDVDANGNLVLSDNGYTKTTRTNIVFWKIETTKVTEIVEISMKNEDGNINVFIPQEPRRIILNEKKSDWRGRVNPLLPIPRNEKAKFRYNIVWKDNNNQENTYDPTIEVYR